TGTIVDVRVFSRRGVEKDERALSIERAEIERLAKDRDDERVILQRSLGARLKELLIGQQAVSGPKGVRAGQEITEADLQGLTTAQWRQIVVEDEKRMNDLEQVGRGFDDAVEAIRKRFDDKVEKLQRGDELPPGVMKMV